MPSRARRSSVAGLAARLHQNRQSIRRQSMMLSGRASQVGGITKEQLASLQNMVAARQQPLSMNDSVASNEHDDGSLV
jgi:hypothetical protein